jgi:hypothetical protein
VLHEGVKLPLSLSAEDDVTAVMAQEFLKIASSLSTSNQDRHLGIVFPYPLRDLEKGLFCSVKEVAYPDIGGIAALEGVM